MRYETTPLDLGKARDDICGDMLPLIRMSGDEAIRFAMCRLPLGHTGWHCENEGLHPVKWTETQATGVVEERRAWLDSQKKGEA